eukprot:6492590-Amphidinium_carterae.2
MSTGEAELRALSRAGVEVLATQGVMKEMGIECDSVRVMTDASAAWSNALKLGPGRMRHLSIAECFIKEAAYHKFFTLCKIKGKLNPADIHTKHVDSDTLERHRMRTGYGDKFVKSAFKLVEVERINDITDLEDAEKAREHVNRMKEKAAEQTLKFGLELHREAECSETGMNSARLDPMRAK